jgi:hypothetical protein
MHPDIAEIVAESRLDGAPRFGIQRFSGRLESAPDHVALNILP